MKQIGTATEKQGKQSRDGEMQFPTILWGWTVLIQHLLTGSQQTWAGIAQILATLIHPSFS